MSNNNFFYFFIFYTLQPNRFQERFIYQKMLSINGPFACAFSAWGRDGGVLV